MSTMTISTTTSRTISSTPAPRTPHGQVRLTRRGRLVVLAIALLAVLAVGVVLASGSVATDEPGTPEPTRVITVDAGQTLWDIAADLADDGDVRSMVDHIEHLNALESGMLVAGQRLVVPRAAA